MIVKQANQYQIKAETTGRKLGAYSTLEAAKRRLQQIEYFKQKKGQKENI